MDILFFAALAFYIFLKLGKNLGKIDDEEKRQIQEKIEQRRREILNVQDQIVKQQSDSSAEMKIINPDKIHSTADSDDKLFDALDEKNKVALNEILARTKITASFFIAGAKSCFEMIIKAFAEGDFIVLKFLLSNRIYEGFEAVINQRKTEEKALVTNLISINSAEILSASILDNSASITVKIVSKQINYITNKDGVIIEGRKDDICEITDIWTFTKDVANPDPKWIVSVTAK